MFTKKFIKVSKVKKLQDAELQKIKGGVVTLPLYGVKPLYGITPLYGIKE